MDEDQEPISEASDTAAEGTPDSAPDSAPDRAPDAADGVPPVRVTTPLCERTHRLHWFTGRLGQVLDDVVGPDGQAGLALGTLGVAETAETVIELDQEIARLEGLRGSVLAHADALNVAAEVTPVGLTTGGWFAAATKTTRPAATRMVKQALRLCGERAATGAALRAGDIDAARAKVVVDAVDALPVEVGPVLLAQAEAHMLELACEFDADALKRLAKHLHEVIDPEGAEEALARQLEAEEEAAYAAARVTVRDTGNGRIRATLDLPALHGGAFTALLDAFNNPRRPRHREQLCEHQKGKGKRGKRREECLQCQDRRDAGDSGETLPPARNGWMKDPTDPTRTISLAEARGRAFLELLEGLDPKKLPRTGGSIFTVVVTVTLASLLGGLRPAMVDTGHLISAGEARRLAARHGVIPAVLGSKSEVLDVGRRKRLHTDPMRIAMRVERQTCAVDGCTIPAAWCDAHHKIFWEHLGPTSVKEGVLACSRHHRMIHNRNYKTTYGPDGTIYIIRIRG